jgi:hypothetical protein
MATMDGTGASGGQMPIDAAPTAYYALSRWGRGRHWFLGVRAEHFEEISRHRSPAEARAHLRRLQQRWGWAVVEERDALELNLYLHDGD